MQQAEERFLKLQVFTGIFESSWSGGAVLSRLRSKQFGWDHWDGDVVSSGTRMPYLMIMVEI